MSDLRLIDAVNTGNHAEIEKLVRGGTDVNQQDEQGWTPLNFAAGKGDLSMVQLLVENGADIFKVGRDRRTPYQIALAAGRLSVVKYLRDAEDKQPERKTARPLRKYCKAYYLKDLRTFPGWNEGRIHRKQEENNGNGASVSQFTDDKVVFIHQDLTVTELVWHGENVIFDDVSPAWEEFCTKSLKFKVPDDLDLIVPNERNS